MDGIHVTLTPGGSGSLIVAGQVSEIHEATLDSARQSVLKRVGEIAKEVGRPVVISVREPAGSWLVTVDEHGQAIGTQESAATTPDNPAQAGPPEPDSPSQPTDLTNAPATHAHPENTPADIQAPPLASGVGPRRLRRVPAQPTIPASPEPVQPPVLSDPTPVGTVPAAHLAHGAPEPPSEAGMSAAARLGLDGPDPGAQVAPSAVSAPGTDLLPFEMPAPLGGMTHVEPPRRRRKLFIVLAAILAVIILAAAALVGLRFVRGGASKEPAPAPTASASARETPMAAALRAGSGSWVCQSTTRLTCWGADPNGAASPPLDITGIDGTVEHLAVGRRFGVAVTDTGGVWAWGDNSRGQLGVSETPASGTAVKVGDLPAPAVALVAGVEHACAATTSGEIFCFGSTRVGQVGGAVSETPAGLTRIEAVSGAVSLGTSGYDTWAITADGAVIAWGSNQWGQVNPASPGVSSTPTEGQ